MTQERTGETQVGGTQMRDSRLAFKCIELEAPLRYPSGNVKQAIGTKWICVAQIQIAKCVHTGGTWSHWLG